MTSFVCWRWWFVWKTWKCNLENKLKTKSINKNRAVNECRRKIKLLIQSSHKGCTHGAHQRLHGDWIYDVMQSAWVAWEPWLSQPPLLFEENMHTRVTSETLPLCSCQSCAALGITVRLTSAYSISVDGCQRGRVCAPMTGRKTGWRTADLCGTAVEA